MFTPTATRRMGRTIPVLGLGNAVMLTPAACGQAVTHGDSSFNLPPASTTGAIVRTSTTGGTAAILVAGGDTTDQLFQQWWWYRVDGVNPREFGLSNRTANNAAGNVLTLTYSEPEGFLARVRYTLTDGPNTPASCNVGVEVQLTNTLTTPLSIALFNYLDYDVEGAAGDSAALLAPGRIEITDAAGFRGQMLGVESIAYQVAVFATVRNNLTDAGVDDFASTGLPFASSDFTGGQQWNLAIAPGASQTVRAAFSVNMTAVAPALCRADFNGDTAVNSQDFFDFLAAFFVTAPSADFNGDAAINSQDFFDFLTEFFAGCP